MTRSTEERRVPGRLLLKVAPWIFEEPALSTIVYPTLADMQQEVDDAGANRRRRLIARWRGYCAFWRLVAVVPFALPVSATTGRFVTPIPGRHGGGALVLLVATLFAAIWPIFGGFVVGTAIGGLVLAVMLRWWHQRHPSVLAPDDPLAKFRFAEINLSSIPVAGDIGGLMFVVGSVAIVMLGLPELRWFLLATVFCGTLLAAGLFAWRTAHPSELVAENSIIQR